MVFKISTNYGNNKREDDISSSLRACTGTPKDRGPFSRIAYRMEGPQEFFWSFKEDLIFTRVGGITKASD